MPEWNINEDEEQFEPNFALLLADAGGCWRLLQYRLQIDQMLSCPAAVHGAMSYGQIAAVLIKLG